MRKMLTLDPDVERLLSAEMERLRQPLAKVVNNAIRRGLDPRSTPTAAPPYRTVVHKAKLNPRYALRSPNRLVDEIG